MSQFTIVVPEYSRRFRCIGPDCEDDCCHGWTVHIDRKTLAKYRNLPAGPLRSQLDACIQDGQPADGAPATAASILMLPSGACPFLTGERLCHIQQELGHASLSHTCRQYPRHTDRIDGIEISTLSLSCPEAARLVLLDPELLASPLRRHKVTWNPSVQCGSPLRTFYWAIREFAVGLIGLRSYALWERLFLLGIFCQRLDAIAQGQDARTFPEFIRDFGVVVSSGSLRGPMQTIPYNPALQLQLLFRLINLRAGSLGMRSSLQACLTAFNSCIGSGEGVTLEHQIDAYSSSYASFFAPFFQERPWILENYLLNDLLAGKFPFGASFSDGKASHCMEAFAQLTARFGILKGLLIGVAGARQSSFSSDDVVQTVSAVSRQFEHSREFLRQSYDFLRDNNLADVAGLTALLRN